MPAETHRSVARIDSKEILDLVRDALVENLGPALIGDPDAIETTTGLIAIGVDDLTLIDIVQAIEEEVAERTVGLTVADEDLADLETVGDLVALVAQAAGVNP